MAAVMGRARKLHLTSANQTALRELLTLVAEDECVCRYYVRAEPDYRCTACRARTMLKTLERCDTAALEPSDS